MDWWSNGLMDWWSKGLMESLAQAFRACVKTSVLSQRRESMQLIDTD